MSMIKEFLTFLKNYQVIGLAVAVIIGAAAGKLVSAFVNDIVMPIVGLLMPGGDWRTFSISLTGQPANPAAGVAGKNLLLIGDIFGAMIDFIIIAAVVFIVVKMVMKGDTTKKV
jgi:large conductance mechanosensitive channel